jgi:sugar-specific transcriptional regulator TrmB
MSNQTDNLLGILEPFGLSQEESKIYLELLEKKISTALSLSRSLHIGRTKVYRILDKLIEKELVVQQLDSSGFKFIANDPNQLSLLLTKKESELISLQKNLPQVIKMLQSKVDSGKSGSRILYYRGQEGLSQVNWNLLRAKGEFLSYEVSTASAYLPQAEAEKLRQAIVEKKIFVRTLTNKTYQEPYTDVIELVKKWWQLKYISPKNLQIRADIFIYNDIYAVCNYLDTGDVFCFEIYNEHMAQMQRDIFEQLWSEAAAMKAVDDKGGMKVLEITK